MADIEGAVHLAARIRARVGVGTTIELVQDGPPGSDLGRGDRGVVREITADGCVVVHFERGISMEIDPDRLPYRRAHAA
ncbi:MAG: hypothetical protein ACR2HI_11825 [Gaiella sp.]